MGEVQKAPSGDRSIDTTCLALSLTCLVLAVTLAALAGLVALVVPRYLFLQKEMRERDRKLNRKIDKIDQAFAAWMSAAGVVPVPDNGRARR